MQCIRWDYKVKFDQNGKGARFSGQFCCTLFFFRGPNIVHSGKSAEPFARFSRQVVDVLITQYFMLMEKGKFEQ